MGNIKRLLPFFIGMLILPAMMACNPDIKSVTPSFPTEKEDNTPTLAERSVRPPITKYLITTSKNPVGYANGEVYLTDSYSRGDNIKIEEYWVKENDYWIYHREIKEFPLNVRLESYPSGGEFGYDKPSDPKYYILMPDGIVYATRNELIPVTSETIRISSYYVRETPEGRWYYSEEPLDLPKGEARIEQVKM